MGAWKSKDPSILKGDEDDACDGAERYLVAIVCDEPPLVPQIPHAKGLAGTRHGVYSLQNEANIEGRSQRLGRSACVQPRHNLRTGGKVGFEGRP